MAEAEFSAGANGHASNGSRRGFGQPYAHDRAAQSAARDVLYKSLTWFELLVHPSMLLRLIPALLAASVATTLVFGDTKVERRDAVSNPLVAAWHNPRTQRWEAPAPWDPDYQKLKPKIEQIARNLVYSGR